MLKASLCSSNLKSALDKQNAQIFTPVYFKGYLLRSRARPQRWQRRTPGGRMSNVDWV